METIERDLIGLQLVSDANQYLSHKQRKIKISHLGPAEQPELHESSKILELKWKLRIYDASRKSIKRAERISRKEQKKHLRRYKKKVLALLSQNLRCFRSGYHIPGSLWLDIIEAVKSGNDSKLNERLGETDQLIAQLEEREFV